MKISTKLVVAGLVVAALAGGYAVTSWQRSIEAARVRIADPKYPVEPLLSTIRGLWFPPADLKQAIDKRLKFELASFRQPIEKATRPEHFRALDRMLAQFDVVVPTARGKQLDGLKAYRVEREEVVEFQALDTLVAHNHPYGEPARAFVKKYPAGKWLPKVQTWLHRADQAAEAKDRAELESLKIATHPEVEAKVAEMTQFLTRYPLAHDATEMRRAVELAKKLLATTTVKIVVAGAGRFNTARDFSVKVLVDDALAHEVLSEQAAQEGSWENPLALAWTPGQSITLVLYDYRFRNEEAARVQLTGAWAVRALDGRRDLEPADGWEPYLEGKPFATCRTPEYTEADWALLDAFFPSTDF